MGGEPLVTPPGFHFFTATLILLTGMPLIMAQLVTASFFSAFMVFPAYLTSKRIWKKDNAGMLAAFFAVVSALSLEMICWGGYTNIVSLALIATIFYLFLKDVEKPSYFHLLIGTLLFGSLILTHTFSLFVFFPILIVYFVFLLLGKSLKVKKIQLVKPLRFFAVSGALGVLTVLPWILRVFSFYLNTSSEGVIGGIESNKNIILANRNVDSMILLLVFALIPTVIMFRASRRRYIDNGSLLVVAWFLVPLFMTQAYLVGIYVDYSRFMYFIDFPGILIISAGLYYLFRYTAIAANKSPRIKGSAIKKLAAVSICALCFFGFIAVSPWSIFPNDAMERADFYTTIHKPEAEAIKWISNNTPKGSVLVSDHLYGWWLSGISERPTLSAAGLEYLLYEYEVKVAKSATLLLDTDYFVDNGLIQVRENGPYLSRHNPGFSIETWTGASYSMIYFQDNQTTLGYYKLDGLGNTIYQNITLAEIKSTGMTLVSNEKLATITITRENSYLKSNRTLTLQRGVRFAELSYQIAMKDPQINIFEAELAFNTTKGNIIQEPGWLGVYDQNQRACAQLIFKEKIPEIFTSTKEQTEHIRLVYDFSKNWTANIDLLVGVFDAQNLGNHEIIETYRAFFDFPQKIGSSDPLYVWDYVEMIRDYNVSYVAFRDTRLYSKFSEDTNFRLVFNSGDVAVFQVVN